MIKTDSTELSFLTRFSSSRHSALADAPLEKGGQGAGFDPHELLESALGTCLNIVVRKKANQLNFPLERVSTTVSVDRTSSDVAAFSYEIELEGPLSDEQRQSLLDAARTCPVSHTLSKRIVFAMKESR